MTVPDLIDLTGWSDLIFKTMIQYNIVELWYIDLSFFGQSTQIVFLYIRFNSQVKSHPVIISPNNYWSQY